MALVGDSSETPRTACPAPLLAQRPELRDVRVETGDRNSELAIHGSRARRALRFFRPEVGSHVGIVMRGTLREFRREARSRCSCASSTSRIPAL